VVFIHNGVLLSHKEEQNFVICKEMELENIILNKVSQVQKSKTHMFSMDFRSKITALIFLDMGHTLRGESVQEE
jgi:hypothetical protein